VANGGISEGGRVGRVNELRITPSVAYPLAGHADNVWISRRRRRTALLPAGSANFWPDDGGARGEPDARTARSRNG
jgi:hypothetical protein